MAVEIIAEVGINHQRDMETGLQLINAAHDAGATVVKFQASSVVEEVSFVAAPDHFAELGELVPDWTFLKQMKAECDRLGVEFLCTPAGEDSLAFVAGMGVQRLKVSSDNLTNVPFLRAVARTGLPVILSTGMSTIPEIMKASGILATAQRSPVLLHCVSLYPCPLDRINLSAMAQMRRYGQVGLSDHTTSILVPALAVAMGAVMIEKHITLDRTMPGPDHAASLEPREFRDMVALVRQAEAARGWGNKEPVGGEAEAALHYRKSIVARTTIKTGETFTSDNLTTKRPGTGRSASQWDSVLGTVARRSYEPDELIQ